eukprot:scaffold445527_cov47-Prasinocladus_malaysianus.AAC.1
MLANDCEYSSIFFVANTFRMAIMVFIARLGEFTREEDAARCYDRCSALLWGLQCRTNFPLMEVLQDGAESRSLLRHVVANSRSSSLRTIITWCDCDLTAHHSKRRPAVSLGTSTINMQMIYHLFMSRFVSVSQLSIQSFTHTRTWMIASTAHVVKFAGTS